jgi:branched-chain amino acid transport system permease protein
MNKNIGYLIAFAVALAAPFIGYPVFLMKLLCFGLFACAFNLLIGYTGLLSFGHAAFFGAAGYFTGYALTTLGLPTELGILVGVVVAALIGLVMGWLAIRRQGIYFTMITLALAQMVYFGMLRAPFTHGEDGLQGIPRGKLLGVIDLTSDTTMYYVVLAIAIAGFALIVRIVHSPFGQVLKAIKENEPRAISLGYDVDRYKLTAFVLSAALAGLAGAPRPSCWALKP